MTRRARFTDAEKLDIARALILREGTWAQIRERYGISQGTLAAAVKQARESGQFANVPPAPRGPMRKLTAEQRAHVIATLRQAKHAWPAMPKLAAQYGVHVSTIERHWIAHLRRNGLTRGQQAYRLSQMSLRRVSQGTSINVQSNNPESPNV